MAAKYVLYDQDSCFLTDAKTPQDVAKLVTSVLEGNPEAKVYVYKLESEYTAELIINRKGLSDD